MKIYVCISEMLKLVVIEVVCEINLPLGQIKRHRGYLRVQNIKSKE
jgi:hypothetical protein